VRLIFRKCCAVAGLGMLLFACVAFAQNPDTIAPDESTAMAKRIVNQVVQAMGGQAYLNMSERECDGRRALIGHNGELSGYIGLKDAWQYPDKDRIDYVAHSRNTLLGFIIGVQDLDITKGGTVITLFSGDTGWIMDKSGVSELPATSVGEFQAALKQNIDNLLRVRARQEGTQFRWGGLGTVDLRPADWVEITDTDGQMTRVAVDRSTHLPLRNVVVTQDEELGQSREDVAIYTNYQPKSGVQIPMQVTRERDGRRILQVFYDDCRPNPALAQDYFTRQALDEKYKEVGKKSKPNK
jgi:hypothetical protein